MPKGGGGHNLPAEYQEVKYLKSDNKSYIDTGVIVPKTANTVGAKVTGKFNQISGYSYMFGVQNGGGLGVQFNLVNSTYRIGAARINMEDIPHNPRTDYVTVEANYENNGKALMDGDELVLTTFPGNDYNLLLFGYTSYQNVPTYNYGQTSIRYAEITEGTSVIRQLIPCYRKTDHTAGMYDLVNDVFYTNAGPGTFVIGPNV